jgi:hypothetical protein
MHVTVVGVERSKVAIDSVAIDSVIGSGSRIEEWQSERGDCVTAGIVQRG